MADAIKVTPDPQNPGSVVLSGWPNAKQKTKAFRARVAAARGEAPEAPAAVEDTIEATTEDTATAGDSEVTPGEGE